MVFPLPVLLELADVVVSTALDQLLTERFAYSIEETLFHGGVRYSQPLDLTLGKSAYCGTEERGGGFGTYSSPSFFRFKGGEGGSDPTFSPSNWQPKGRGVR